MSVTTGCVGEGLNPPIQNIYTHKFKSESYTLKTTTSSILLPIILLVGLMSISAGIILAQTETPSPTPDPNIPTPTIRPVDLACDLESSKRNVALSVQQLAVVGELLVNRALDNIDPPEGLSNV